jgi:ADP-ribose pyrophosphatase YjhB (NUDIX family)
MDWTRKSTKIVYENPWIKVREDQIVHPSGKEGIYGVVEVGPGVFVVGINEKNEILFVKQNRYCTGITSWEIPGGGLKKGYEINDQASEELKEEAGYKAQSFEVLGKTQTQPGVTNQIDFLILAKGLTSIHENVQEVQAEEGISSVQFFPLPKVLEMIKSGEISHGQSITGIMLYLNKENRIK